MKTDLPDYFLADLPPEAPITSRLLAEACQTLKRNREQYLLHRSTQSLVEVLGAVANEWMNPSFPLRRLALREGPILLGFSESTLQMGLDGFFREITPENLVTLLQQELGHVKRLDDVVTSREESVIAKSAMARGPEFLVHIGAGNLPIPALTSLLLGILTRSAQLLKCASGTSLLPRLFAHTLYQLEPKLAACLEVAEWPGGNADLESVLLAEADCITATGADETLAQLRRNIPRKARYLEYGHRVSFGYISHRGFMSLTGQRWPRLAARDVAAWNQLGCLSPHVFYVERGSNEAGLTFAEKLAEEMARQEEVNPRGPLPLEISAAIAKRRSFYEIRAAHSPQTVLWSSPNSTAWTVVYEADHRFQASCLHRFIYVKGVDNLTDALRGADSIRHQTSTVGLGVDEDEFKPLAAQVGRWGATRICPLGKMQLPPLTWRHDGRPALADLITWIDCEL